MARKTPSSREEAREMIEKRRRSERDPKEEKLQQDIVVSFYDKYPDSINELIGYDANGIDGKEGSKKLGMGVRPKVSDLMWFNNHKCHGLELKTTYSRHDSEHVLGQAKFIIEKCGQGAFITSVDMFWDYLEGRGNGISPHKVKEYIKKTKKKTVKFGDIEKWL